MFELSTLTFSHDELMVHLQTVGHGVPCSYLPNTFLNRSIISGRWDIISLAKVSISSPDVYSASSFLLFTSSENALSFKVFSNASRRILTCSARMPGGPMYGR